MSAQVAPSRHRDVSLDGLRGLAAVVVLIHHSLLVIPDLAQPYDGTNHANGWAWWLTNTPLHTVWAGPEAVYVFFLLSGFVLMPRTVRTVRAWWSYYASRLLRLYLPVFSATMLALLVVLTVPRHSSPHASWWINAHARPWSPASVLRDAYLVSGTDWLNSAFWSLRWEVFFSVLLPVYFIFSRTARRLWPIKVLALFVLIGFGVVQSQRLLIYPPMFALGSMLAVERDKVESLLQRASDRTPRTFWTVALITASLALNAVWLASMQHTPSNLVTTAATLVEVAGALLVLLIALAWPAARTSLARPMPKWLGSRSFSLYLVHEPIVVSIAVLLGPRLSPLTIVCAVPVALLVAEIFYRLIERPSHRLSRRLGTRVAPGRKVVLVPEHADAAPVRLSP